MPPWFLLPCKITKASGWNVQQKWISLTGYYVVVSIFPSQTTIGGQKIMNEQATRIFCG